jgi:hypothetical protein
MDAAIRFGEIPPALITAELDVRYEDVDHRVGMKNRHCFAVGAGLDHREPGRAQHIDKIEKKQRFILDHQNAKIWTRLCRTRGTSHQD